MTSSADRCNHTVKGLNNMALRLKYAMNFETLEPSYDLTMSIEELDAQMGDLRRFRDEGLFRDSDWQKSVRDILDFQHEDGSFGFVDPRHVPADARVDFVYRPSYACCQVLIKLVLEVGIDDTVIRSLSKGLEFCCKRRLFGHGFDGSRQQIEDINDFVSCGTLELASSCPDVCPEFFALLNAIGTEYAERVRTCNVFDDFGEFLAVDTMQVARALGHEELLPLFVYGTLMTGMPNESLVSESGHLGAATVSGFTLYDLGAYPSIRHTGANGGESLVHGEIRLVDVDTLVAINRLEGEGALYRAERVTARIAGREVPAIAYVYLHDINSKNEVPTVLQPYNRYVSVRDSLIWYVCYGSNMLFERFMNYVRGGRCRFNERSYGGCSDTTPPLASEPILLPYSVYFGNMSGSWDGSGVAFLDPAREGQSFARAYLITREQFEQIHSAEGRSESWYPDALELDSRAGIPMVTFTNRCRRPENAPSEAYLEVMRSGLRETHFHEDPDQLESYLREIAST